MTLIRALLESRLWIVCALVSFMVSSGTSADAQARRQGRPGRGTRATAPRQAAEKLPCGDLFGFEVLLDRQGFSPGEIDGARGPNLNHAIAAVQQAHGMEATGEPDCDTWHVLGGDTAGSTTKSYVVTDEDMKGPFLDRIPPKLPEQAKLTQLAYTSAVEKLAERFHVNPALLRRMNDGAPIKAGATVTVPAVEPFDPGARKPTPDPAASTYAVSVSREESALRVTKPDGTIVFFAPVTTGSEHDPLPPGDWKVTAVDWHPAFHYNPDLFWDAKATDPRVTIKPGPNNPVGVVWIDLTKEHYGLHGTPEPSRIGHTASHGCVRLTNWDAARLAGLVTRGTAVKFR